MDAAEFDKFAVEYDKMHRKNIRVSGETPEFFAEYKVLDMRRDWDRRHGGEEPGRILDFGGGTGASAKVVGASDRARCTKEPMNAFKVSWARSNI